MIAKTLEAALAQVRLTLKNAQPNNAGTVIAALKSNQWHAVAYKTSEGWMSATMNQQAQALPAHLFPAIPPTALQVYCQAVGWQGGTIHQAIADLKKQSNDFRNRLLEALPKAEWDAHGVDMLLAAI